MTKTNLKRLEEGKLYYSISEVCTMTGLEQHVLRYWESEFPQLKPKKNRSGNRAYRSKEIKIIHYIKFLLHEEKYTIPGAKKKMSEANMSDIEGQQTLLKINYPKILPKTKKKDEENKLPASEIELSGGTIEASELRKELLRVKLDLNDLLLKLEGTGRKYF